MNPYDNTLNGSYDCYIAKFDAMGDLEYSTFFGGSAIDSGRAIDVDSEGNIYVTGVTSSDDFPVYDAYQEEHGGNNDGFILILNANGDEIIFASYLGGALEDYLYDISVDNEQNCYLFGYSSSTDFPMVSAFNDKINGSSDTIVAKLTNSGTLAYSSYLGGNQSDVSCASAVDQESIRVEVIFSFRVGYLAINS
jgi:hypothetical protein